MIIIVYIIIGIVLGWLTKTPWLLKQYRELQKTRDYRDMKVRERYEELQKKIDKDYGKEN